MAKAFQLALPDCQIIAVPLVGAGLYYQQMGLTPAIRTPVLPSGGFIRDFKSLWGDLKAGLISIIRTQRQQIQVLQPSADCIVCVGDVYALWMGHCLDKNRVVFLPTAKSDLIVSHSFMERIFIKKWAGKIYTRDSETAKSLQHHRLPAIFLGNPMTDELPTSKTDYTFSANAKTIGILPGSRAEAYQNLVFILQIISQLSQKDSSLQYILGIAQSLDSDELVRAVAPFGWKLQSSKNMSRLSHSAGVEVKIAAEFGDVITHSDLILGLAGTANEQAVYMGKPVMCFEGFGPQSTRQRFIEQKKLLGDRLILIENRRIETIVSSIHQFLSQHSSQSSGQFIPPSQNAAKQIVDDVISNGLAR